MNNSSKKTIATVAVIVLLLLAFFMYNSKNTPKSTAGGDDKKTTTVDNEITLKGSMFDLLKAGNTTKCTYSTKDETISMKGTTYVSGKKMRSDSEVTTKDGLKTESHMISDGTWIYTWTSAAPQGFKMKVEEAETPKSDDNTETTAKKGSADIQSNYDFKCSKWIADSSKFDVPADVTFTDFSETLKNLNKDGSLCTTCDYAQDADAKAQCRTQFGCN